MTRVAPGGEEMWVTSATSVSDDTETLEFRLVESAETAPDIAVSQRGEYASPDVVVLVPREISLATLEDALVYARERLGLSEEGGASRP